MTINVRLLLVAGAAAALSLGLAWGSTPTVPGAYVPGFCTVDPDGWMDCSAGTFLPGFGGYRLKGHAARAPLALGATAVVLGLRRRRPVVVRAGLVIAAVGLVPRAEIDPSSGQGGRVVYLAALVAAAVATGTLPRRRWRPSASEIRPAESQQ